MTVSHDGTQTQMKNRLKILNPSSSGLGMYTGITKSDYNHSMIYSPLPPSTIEVVKDRWIVHQPSNRVISKIPAMIPYFCSASNKDLLVIGTRTGRIITMRFPPVLFALEETRPTDGQGRNIPLQSRYQDLVQYVSPQFHDVPRPSSSRFVEEL